MLCLLISNYILLQYHAKTHFHLRHKEHKPF
nr:MAG TPA: hypothetical protein [Caudoviricetes sp.]